MLAHMARMQASSRPQAPGPRPQAVHLGRAGPGRAGPGKAGKASKAGCAGTWMHTRAHSHTQMYACKHPWTHPRHPCTNAAARAVTCSAHKRTHAGAHAYTHAHTHTGLSHACAHTRSMSVDDPLCEPQNEDGAPWHVSLRWNNT